MTWMKHLLVFPFQKEPSISINDPEFAFSSNLLSFFDFYSKHKNLHVEYILYHFFFWTISERVIFPDVLKKALYRSTPNFDFRMKVFDGFLRVKKLFVDWHTTLQGHPLFHAIWQKGDPQLSKTTEEQNLIESKGAVVISPYRGRAILVRFFGDHSNDGIYRLVRGDKGRLDKPILAELYGKDDYPIEFPLWLLKKR
ncbi:hypothetical protein OROGR_025226 [Orobanche gracilis]